MRAATMMAANSSYPSTISIHAAQAGSDTAHKASVAGHGGFQPTLPMRAAPWFIAEGWTVSYISIHAAHAGSDLTVKAG